MAAKTYQEIARAADAVRVSVWRDKQVWKSEVEALHEGNWWVLLDTGAVINADADVGNAVLTFPGGEQVTIGAPEASNERAKRDHTLGMLEGERQLAALRERARCDAAREEPAPPVARWWQTVGAWGARFAPGPVTIDPYQVVQVEGDRGAWVRSMAGVIALAPADRLDGMKPITAPPDAALRAADEDRELRARINRIRSAAAQAIAPEDAVSFVQDLLRGDL